IHSTVFCLHCSTEIQGTIQISLSFLENLNKTHEWNLNRILGFLIRIRSCVMCKLSMRDLLVQSIIKKVGIATSLLSCNNVPTVLTVNNHVVRSAITNKILKSL
ncbi:hypothetical protein CFOL_v3_08240, partial [Cephalotus follicularis]